jgi:hypothetical protein
VLQDLLSSEVQKFIRDHENDDERKLVLKQKEISGIATGRIAEQIAARRKAKEKLPTFYNTIDIIYPPTANLEQSSSEQTAKFKSDIIASFLHVPHMGDRPKPRFRQGVGADLTAGFGIDTYFLSNNFSDFDYVEPNTNLLEIARHNHNRLNANNISYHNTNAENFLNTLDRKVDLIFIDPSRRTENKKVFTLKDSEPDIVSLQSKVYEKSDLLLIKASPLLDIKLALKELSFVSNVFVVAVENEVKELLFLGKEGFNDEPKITAVNLSARHGDASFDFSLTEENALDVKFHDPLEYLYEPNAAILKAGAFKTVAVRFNINKIQSSTHFYTSDNLIANFPGRVFKIQARVKPDPKELQQFFPDGKANVTTRNYPLSVEDLKKKTKLKDGGEKFLIGFSGVKEKFLVVATRVDKS